MIGPDDLDKALIEAHTRQDAPALVALYTEAAEAAQDETRSAFYLTHAYVFALEAGLPQASDLHKRLKDMGREA